MTSPQASPLTVKHLVVGAGFAGLCAAIKLQEDGERDFVVVERGSDVGGTWRDNTYPGAACDVPSQLYSYSFAPNPDWSSSYSPQPEIQAYIQSVAQRSGVLDRFVFDTAVQDLSWDDEAQRWSVTTSGATYSAQFVVLGAGALSEPALPDIEGIGDFQGELFHSATWDHSIDLRGKRVAVIGTGASAIQLVPEVAKRAGHLDVYQRTAPWVLPRVARRYSAVERAALRHVPGLQKAYRVGDYWLRESNVPVLRAVHVADRGAPDAGAAQHPPRDRGPGAARGRDTRLHAVLQADPAEQRLVPHARPAARRPGHRPDRRG